MGKKLVRVETTVAFEKQLKKAPLNIKEAFHERLLIFRGNCFHPLLHNHALIGQYKELRSINITGDWRALYREIELDDEQMVAVFHLVGTHSQLYKK